MEQSFSSILDMNTSNIIIQCGTNWYHSDIKQDYRTSVDIWPWGNDVSCPVFGSDLTCCKVNLLYSAGNSILSWNIDYLFIRKVANRTFPIIPCCEVAVERGETSTLCTFDVYEGMMPKRLMISHVVVIWWLGGFNTIYQRNTASLTSGFILVKFKT